MRQELLYQEALTRKLDQQARLKMLLEQTRRDLLVAALLDDEFSSQELDFSEDDILRYYDVHQDQFQRAIPEVKARHILLSSQREANARRQALQRGEKFTDVAHEHSLDVDTRYQSGDLGYFSEVDEPTLWAATRELPLNRVSKSIRTEYGYHLIQILDRQEAGRYYRGPGARTPQGQTRPIGRATHKHLRLGRQKSSLTNRAFRR